VTEAVLDASVVLKWFRAAGERHLAAARSLRAAFEAGELIVIAPSLLPLEILNVAARRWQWEEAALLELVTTLAEARFELRDPELDRVARWTGEGLTAYDAAYIAVAEAEAIPLFTDDDLIVQTAPQIATALGTIASGGTD
jgi:predicted nucleic acid-binding protein